MRLLWRGVKAQGRLDGFEIANSKRRFLGARIITRLDGQSGGQLRGGGGGGKCARVLAFLVRNISTGGSPHAPWRSLCGQFPWRPCLRQGLLMQLHGQVGRYCGGRSTAHDGRRPLQSVAVALGCSRGGTGGQGGSSLCLPLLSVSGEAIRYSVISYQLLLIKSRESDCNLR